MTEKQTSILGFITLIAVLLAVWLLFGEKSGEPETLQGRQLLPTLSQQLSNIGGITVQDSLNTTTITRDDETWHIAEKDGYPADTARIRTMLKGLAQSRIHLVKTDNPALYDRLGLGDDSTQLSITDNAGTILASLYLGDRTYENDDFLTYVRPADDARSYQVTDIPEILATPVTWLDTKLFEIARTRIGRIVLHHKTGDSIDISRMSPDSPFGLEALGSDERESNTQPLEMLATAYTDLYFKDVRKAQTGEPETADEAEQAVLETFDGLDLRFRFRKTGDETGDAWVTVEARYEAPDEEAMPERLPDAVADVAAEADALAKRFDGWAYRLPATTVASLLKRREDLTDGMGPQD